MSSATNFDDSPPIHSSPSADTRGRLLDIVGELLLENQNLRFQVAHLEQELSQTSRALHYASAVYGMLLP